ncbi:hypothetical protein O0I10_000669 [Lichtheimia ornata]|uniref:Uncharacterized protein n=1 Tax=Lichtheimia ornata TaxID=688661 RepID=A0AAD7Y434_9FUNG|nr:uncharacterized protein O0I10_000669 [Lichtheimia ornata]KAJ8663430.1 hypothetical protein O0I10_000669 [Lichtheimia ornata]
MTTETPVNAGHSFATTAEDYEDREEWAKAAEAHAMAASQFQRAIQYAQDAMAAKTLRLLTSNHLRKAKDLERRMTRQQQQQFDQGHDPEDMNEPEGSLSSHGTINNNDNNDDRSFDMDSLRHALSSDQRHGSATPAIGGSYAVLSQNEEDEEENDPFNKFFEVVEKLMDKLSNPVAFASAPLNENDNPIPITVQSPDDRESDRFDASKMVESYFFVTEALDHPTSARSPQEYSDENEQLKKQVDQLTRRIHELEKAAVESNILKSSILQFKSDVHKQAKRIMQSHDYAAMRASSSAAMLTASGGGGRPISEQLARIRELEEENRQLRVQNEKQQALVNKYRERWEKLKESAKKRRAQPDQDMLSLGRSYSSCSSESARQPTLLRSLAQQSTPSSSSSAHPPRTSSPLAKGSTPP